MEKENKKALGSRGRMWMDDGKHTGIRRKTTQSLGETSYRNDTTNAILPSYYGQAFEDVKNARNFSYFKESIKELKNRGKKSDDTDISYDLQPSFSLIQEGFTPMAIMGKEWDKQWATHNERHLINAGVNDSNVLATEKRWIARANAEESVSVKEFYDLLVADRMTKNPELVESLATKEELEAAGFKVSPLATPIYRGTKANGGYFDLSAVIPQGQDTYFYNSPVYANENIISKVAADDLGKAEATKLYFDWANEAAESGVSFEDYAKEHGQNTGFNPTVVDVNTLNLDAAKSDADLKALISQIEKVTGAKIVASKTLSPDVKVYARKNILRTTGRRVVNYYRVKVNKRANLLRESYTISYNPNSSRGEIAYALMSQVAELSTKPFMNNTERLIRNGRGYNLPSASEFSDMKETLSKFTTSMTTAEIAKIVMNNAEDAAKIEGLAYLKAAQSLAAKPNLADNRHLISLASGYTSAAINRCAAAAGMTLDKYEQVTGKKPFAREYNNSFLASVFSKQKYQDFKMPRLYQPSGFADTSVPEKEEIEKTAALFKNLENLYDKLVAEGKAETEMGKTCKMFFDWANAHEKSGIDYEKFVSGVNKKAAKKANSEDLLTEEQKAEIMEMFFDWKDEHEKSGVGFEEWSKDYVTTRAAKKEQAKQEAIAKEKAAKAEKKEKRTLSQAIQDFFEWEQEYDKTGISFKNWVKMKNIKKQLKQQEKANSVGLVEDEETVKAQLRSMFNEETFADEPKISKEALARVKEKYRASRKQAEEDLNAIDNNESNEVVKQITERKSIGGKRIRDWALNLKIFKGEEQKTTVYAADVTALGRTSNSVKNAVYSEVCDAINSTNEKAFNDAEEKRFLSRKGLFPIGRIVKSNDINAAKKKDNAIVELDKVVDDKVEEILTEAANDETSKAMTGTEVVKKHFENKEKKNAFFLKVIEKVTSPVVKASNQRQETLSC